ncbi:MAG: HIT domain-containing protein [Verrucomicrobia bacterium]|nr:HIT domain-containing protein [Verrucomicrobiota bacterium]
MTFELHPNLAKKIFLVDLPLCRVLLEDEKHYTWLFLVPRRPNLSRTIDLSQPDQLQLLQELDFVQKALWDHFRPTQLNVAAIGNKTAQLHIHVICRNETDPAWPHTVWDHPVRSPYDDSSKTAMTDRLKALLSFQSQLSG